jgi:hypothetical protein
MDLPWRCDFAARGAALSTILRGVPASAEADRADLAGPRRISHGVMAPGRIAITGAVAMVKRALALLAVVLPMVLPGGAGAAQAVQPSGSQAVQPPVAPAPPPVAPAPPGMLPAGTIPPNVSLTVTGNPADAAFLEQSVRSALDRRIRPTLRPGASIGYGSFVPWPLAALPPGGRTAVNVSVTLAGSDSNVWVNGVTTVYITNTTMPPAATPPLLFFSDDPEYLDTEGLVFRGVVDAQRPARLYYYHDDLGLPRDLDVVLTAAAPSRVQVVQSGAGPDPDVMSVGHTVSRDFLLYEQQNEGTIVDVVPGAPVVLRHELIFQGELVAGAMDVRVVNGGPIAVSVVASPAGGRPEPYLNGPRVPYDGHNRHGTFALDGYGGIDAVYTVGGPDVSVLYGTKDRTPHNVDPTDPGHDYGDYGVVHRITFTLKNPTDEPHVVYLYERPRGGPVRSSFLVDGQLKEVGCARLAQPYWFTTYQLAAHTTGASTTLTMTDGGSYYPLEFGATETPPVPVTPRVGSADGCSPLIIATPTPSPAPSLTPAPQPSSIFPTAAPPTAQPSSGAG